jgi:transcriptional regulator with XRE-family HTH domain
MSEKKSSRFQKLSAEEQAVGSRLADIRRFYGYSQAECAKAIHLTRNQLANIESGRVPLRFWTGWRACEFLRLNQYWLAKGNGPKEPFLDLDLKPFSDSLTEESLFRTAVSTTLKTAIFEFEQVHGALLRFYEAQQEEAKLWKKAVEDILSRFVPKIPLSERAQAARDFLSAAETFFRNRERRRRIRKSKD